MTAVLLVTDMAVGSVTVSPRVIASALTGGDCPPHIAKIVIDIRLYKALTALLAGAALSVSGLQMQTLFRNPLAGPYVLGISSGAGLGVAMLMLGLPLIGATASSTLATVGIAGAAWAGAAGVLAIIAAVGHRVRDIMVILILGMMFSSGVSAIVQILQYVSDEQALKSYVIWTMGSLSAVGAPQLVMLSGAVLAGLVLAVIAVKPLNMLSLGETYAVTMGLNVRRTRSLIFVSTALLAGTVTAFCGPIGFIGLAMPHVSRMIFRSGDHRILVPATILTGSSLMLVCDIVSKIYTVPVNALTALTGIPVVIWVVLRQK